jgi:hypothetical protein
VTYQFPITTLSDRENAAHTHVALHPGSDRAGNCRWRDLSAAAWGPTSSPQADFWRSRGSFRLSASRGLHGLRRDMGLGLRGDLTESQ